MWRCPNVSDSCWSKAHTFYIERGLWGLGSTTPTSTNDQKSFRHHGVKVSSVLYKNREDWMLEHKLIAKKGGTHGRKSTKRRTTSTAEPSTRKTKRRRQNHEKTLASSTIDNVRVSGNMADKTNSYKNGSSDDDDESNASHDSLLLKQVTQHVAV